MNKLVKAKESITEKFERLKFNDLEFRKNLIASRLTFIPININISSNKLLYFNIENHLKV